MTLSNGKLILTCLKVSHPSSFDGSRLLKALIFFGANKAEGNGAIFTFPHLSLAASTFSSKNFSQNLFFKFLTLMFDCENVSCSSSELERILTALMCTFFVVDA